MFGFVGMLQECIDYALIESLAKARPDATVFFIGRTLPGVSLDRLKKYPNIVFHGLVPQPELPAFLAQFDVCLNVFRAGALSKDVSPLKFYEYLATGKPIVSTREPLQVSDFADVTYIADSEAEFLEKCAEAAAEMTPKRCGGALPMGKPAPGASACGRWSRSFTHGGFWMRAEPALAETTTIFENSRGGLFNPTIFKKRQGSPCTVIKKPLK